MKLRKYLISLCLIFVSAYSVAGSISISKNISLLAFDGQKARKVKQLQTNDATEHQMVFRVESRIKDGSSERIYASTPIVISFTGVNENISIKAPTIRTIHDAKLFDKEQSIQVSTNSGATIAHKQEKFPQEGGFFPDANIVDDLTAYNSSNGIAAVSAFSGGNNVHNTYMNQNTAKSKITVQGDNVAEQMLQYWFQQADKNTKERFLKWAQKK